MQFNLPFIQNDSTVLAVLDWQMFWINYFGPTSFEGLGIYLVQRSDANYI